MTRALGPRASATAGAGVAWLFLGAIWGLTIVALVGWAGVRAAAWLWGGAVGPFGMSFVVEVFRGQFGRAWPRTPGGAVAGCVAGVYGLVIVAVVVGWGLVAKRLGKPGDPVAALAVNPAMKALAREATAERAVRLRTSLAGTSPKDARPGEIGLELGRLMRAGHRPGGTRDELEYSAGAAVYAGWEDTIVAFMAPRSYKTTALAIPFVLSAPGAVIATSNKGDLWAATSDLRAAATGGTIWLFDPQAIAHQAQGFWWNPLLGLGTVEDADRLAGHFVLTVADDKKRDLWGPAAQDLLASLFLAAASCGGSLHDVGQWLAEPAVPTPVELLTRAGFTAMAMSLRGAQNGAVETRDGIYQTARTAARCLSDPGIMAWVTPPARPLPCFSPDAFAASRDTLYLLSKSRSAAAPLIAALSDTAMRAAERRAERLGGRNEPPLVVPLDEAANICRIADLPDLYSHLGSRGITPVTILQSYEQGVNVWGEHGMAALWGAATVKLVGAGVDSPRLVRDLATLVGQHDVPVRSVTYGGDGRPSESVSLRRQDILEPAAIRALPKGTGLLLATGIKPALLKFTPWFEGPRAAEITASRDAAEAMIRDGARDSHEEAT